MRISSPFVSFDELRSWPAVHKLLASRNSGDEYKVTAHDPGRAAHALNRRAPLTYGSCNDMLTQHNDNARTGAAVCETKLTPSAVAGGSFGKLYSRSVDGDMYAQPLYVSDVAINGAQKNIVIVATMNNSVYAFDADDASASAPLWEINLGAPVPTSVYGPSYRDALGKMGVLSTPVIDKANGLIYVVSAQTDSSAETPVYRHILTALRLADGEVALEGPKNIEATVRGTSPDAVEGALSFNSVQHIQRPSLLLTQGQVIVGFGSHADSTPYHGWLMSYDATNLEQTGVFAATTASLGGSFWQSGQGLAVGPDGSLFGVTSNGFDSDASQPSERVESLIKFTLNPGVQFVDSYTPSNYQDLDAADLDFGSCGPIIPPGSDRVISGGKDGVLYNLPQTDLGGLVDGDPTAQKVAASVNSLYGAPVYFQSTTGPQMFIYPPGDTLKAYAFDNNLLSPLPVQLNSQFVAPKGVPGGILTVSTNGDDAASGIVWANVVGAGNANQATQLGVLRAFAAANITQQLWSSDLDSADALGNFGKFVPPTVADGKVFMATFSNQLVVYGLAVNNQSAVSTASQSPSSSAAPQSSSSAPAIVTTPGGSDVSSSISTAAQPSGTDEAAPTSSAASLQTGTLPALASSTGASLGLGFSSESDVAVATSTTGEAIATSTPAGVVSATPAPATTVASSALGASLPQEHVVTVTQTVDCTSTTPRSSSSTCVSALTDVVNIPAFPNGMPSAPASATSTVHFGDMASASQVLSVAPTLGAATSSALSEASSVSSLVGMTLPPASTTQAIDNNAVVATPTTTAFLGAAAGRQMAPNLALAAVVVQLVRAWL